MHLDARKLENNSFIEGDICIIGAGAAGISIALDWIGTNQKVILLEGGGFNYEAQMQDLYQGTTSGTDFPALFGSRLHYFGGTTGHWAGFCSTFDPIDFKKRSWVPNSGWPISKGDLEPYYEKAHEKIGLGTYNYDLEYWQKEIPNLHAFPLDKSVIWNKIWKFNPARFGNMYKEEIINAKNIHLYTYANAINLTANTPINTIEEVKITNHAGKIHTVKAKKFIMACGAIQNARLLLASNSQAKNGLGNNNDNVGRYFMEHIELESAKIHFFNPFHTDLYQLDYEILNPKAELAITASVQEREKILNGTSSFRFEEDESEERIQTRIASFPDEVLRQKLKENSRNWQQAIHTPQKGKTHNTYVLQVRVEQSPNPNSRISLIQEKDAFGVPRVNVNWDLTELEKRSIRTIHTIIGKQIAMNGLGRVKLMEYLEDPNDMTFPENTHGGNHHMGTTRMHHDPKKGVVNENCQVHGISNLFVAGSACFPTAGSPNPTLTIVALSLRLSDYLKKNI